MNTVTKHRGPDGTGIFVDAGVTLGHNRLSIIDLSDAAAQPMKSIDGKQVIVFNGEIYNFQELKKELASSYPFQSASDTEVILAAYRAWGKECVKRLNGVFAFAIWDAPKKELFLARDPMGVIPLYYVEVGNRFLFSSEIKALLEYPVVSRQLDPMGAALYFRALYAPEPYTAFADVKKFPAGSYAAIKNGKAEVTEYWNVFRADHSTIAGSFAERTRLVRETVENAVLRELVSDRPVGVYLSGGIDSSIVLHSMARMRGNIDTFSVGFDLPKNAEPEKFNHDFFLARKTAKWFGTNHHEYLVTVAEAAKAWEHVVWHLDEPIANPTVIPMFLLSDMAKRTVTVALGGDGGDELFGGYERYRLHRACRRYRQFPHALRHLLNRSRRFEKLNTAPGVDRFALFFFQKDPILSQIFADGAFPLDAPAEFFRGRYFSGGAEEDSESHMMDVDAVTWLADESLLRSNKMSMSHGVEMRVPLLNRDVVQCALRIPTDEKVRLTGKKIILKRAFADVLPPHVLNQPKRGWFSPGAKWLRQEPMKTMMKEILSPSYYEPTRGLFRWDVIEKLHDAHVSGSAYHMPLLWSIASFQTWARRFRVTR